MLGIYLSGTGNTKYCIEKLAKALDEKAVCCPIESENAVGLIKENEEIILGYPIQFSNIPYMVKDFIQSNDIWRGKKVFVVSTMGAFSGDGSGCGARVLKKMGANVVGGLHIRMPDSVCDSPLLKNPYEKNARIIDRADRKIERVAERMKTGEYPHEGLSFIAHVMGLIGQRLWFYGKTKGYSDKLKINNTCVGCGICVSDCPMGNIELKEGKAVAGDKCTMCYRCIANCPNKAITLLGKEVVEQHKLSNYR
ncbi:MAG: EFR1 family ferrodoxin [Lachnospiraceae bacterium]|nr:EFR1 family ferrodoxin [Lachnospiraceae bacterium]